MNDNKNQVFSGQSNNFPTQDASVINQNYNSNQQLNQNMNYYNQNYQGQQAYNQMPVAPANTHPTTTGTHYEPLKPTIQIQTIGENNQIEELETLSQVEPNAINVQPQNAITGTEAAVQTQSQPSVQAQVQPAIQTESDASTPVLDPLNNANNPVPVNPVAPPEVKKKVEAVTVSPLEPLKAILKMIKKPGDLIEEIVPKYEHFMSSAMFTAFLTVITIALTLITRFIVGGFIKTYDNAKGSYSSTFDLSNIGNQNFLHYILIAIIVSGIAIMVISIICYASSFLNSKGMTLGKIIMITNVSFLPIIIGINVLSPLLSVISESVGFAALIISIIYTIMLFVIGMNYYLQTDKLNAKIFYNLLNFSIIVVVVVIVLILRHPGMSIIEAIGVGF